MDGLGSSSLPGLLLLAPLAFAGCGLQRMAARSTAGILDNGTAALDREPDPLFAEQALPADLKTIEVFLQSDPENQKLLRLACRGYAGYAFLFLETTQPDRARGFYLRARDFGLRALELRGLRDLGRAPPAEIERELSSRGARDVPFLFWTALAWAGWINLAKDDPAALADLPRAVALMRRVEQLDPNYYYGGPHLFMGIYHGRPKVFGGDFAKAKDDFEEAAAASRGRFLMTWVRYARVYAVDAQDRGLFNRLLQRVLDAPADVLPEARLANEVAKRQAKELKEHADELFE